MTPSSASRSRRAPITAERIVSAAIDVADDAGLDAVSMRRVGQELGVEAMSLYHHVRNKQQLLDAMVDAIAGELLLPEIGADWKPTIRRSAMKAREVLARHPWAAQLMSFRGSIGPARMRYADAVLGTFREGGFDPQLAHWALHAYVGHVFGFGQQELRHAAHAEIEPGMAAIDDGELALAYPYIAESLIHSTHDDDAEYVLVLDLLLDGLERVSNASRPGTA